MIIVGLIEKWHLVKQLRFKKARAKRVEGRILAYEESSGAKSRCWRSCLAEQKCPH
jgi:hypothetical protein